MKTFKGCKVLSSGNNDDGVLLSGYSGIELLEKANFRNLPANWRLYRVIGGGCSTTGWQRH
jgi:hypothetical protein